MRLTEDRVQAIRHVVNDIAGPAAQIRLFGSRLRDEAAGGDLDLLVEIPYAADSPAELAARLSARISRLLYGRRVDVLLLAPNLARLPIHDVALREGIVL